MTVSVLEARGLAVGHGRRALVSRLDLVIRRGERWWVHGPNGAGKTTLLETLAGVLPPLAGTVVRSAAVGLVAQADTIVLPVPLTAAEFVDLARAGTRIPRARLALALADTGLAGAARQRLAALSGGQRARARLARALLRGPGLLVLDEPTAHLDVEGEADFWRLVAARPDVACVVTTHRPEAVRAWATHRLRLAGDGTAVVETGP